MKIDISIIIPSIRVWNLPQVYDSLLTSTKRNFELIIVGPTVPKNLANESKVKFIHDYGSPVRASQIGAEAAQGELITWSADDALFLPGQLDNCIDSLKKREFEEFYKNVVVAKYYEGCNGTTKPLQPDEYFKINGSTWTSSRLISNDWWIFNVAVMYTRYFKELGGWDCAYQACPLAHTDLAIRAQLGGARVRMSDAPLLDCDHSQPDHMPIEIAQTYDDLPIYRRRYVNANTLENIIINIPINNWRNAEEKWSKRFQNV